MTVNVSDSVSTQSENDTVEEIQSISNTYRMVKGLLLARAATFMKFGKRLHEFQ